MMVTGSSMEDREKRGRTLEEVSHFFLSGERPSKQGERPVGKEAVKADGEATAPMPLQSSPEK